MPLSRLAIQTAGPASLPTLSPGNKNIQPSIDHAMTNFSKYTAATPPDVVYPRLDGASKDSATIKTGETPLAHASLSIRPPL
jgi:hypothetical protein